MEAAAIPPIFKNPLLQKQLDDEGYVKVQLLDEADIVVLTKLFHEFHGGLTATTFQATSYLHDNEIKHRVCDRLYEIFKPHFDRIFQEFTYFGSSFLYKPPGPDSALAPHQDWTIVDEKKFIALNIWTPLIDTDLTNGTLQVIPRSHSNFLFSIRAPTIPFYFQQYYGALNKYLVPVDVKAGEAIILNQSIIHYSAANQSAKVRIAITSGIKSKNAPMLFYYHDKKNNSRHLEKFEMPEDFLISFKNFAEDIYLRPENGVSKGFEAYAAPHISESDFRKKFGKESVKRETFFEKFKAFFS